MSPQPQHQSTSTHPQLRTDSAGRISESQAQERADLEEDRRRERDLDDGEMGGEA